jgi:Replication Fork Protection Component Swi3
MSAYRNSLKVLGASGLSRKDRLAVNRNYYISDEDDDSLSEEEIDEGQESENYLSKDTQSENGNSLNKRKQTDQEIADEYAAASKKRKSRPTFQPKHLTGAEGLIKIRSDMSSLKYPQNQTSIDAAASYSSTLVKAYKNWADSLFPGLAFDDILLRIETFGSKREIKSFLTQMRNEVRDAHLEKLFGREKAAKYIQELEEGLRQNLTHDNVNDSLEESTSTLSS